MLSAQTNWTVHGNNRAQKKHNRPLHLQKRKHTLTEEDPRKAMATGEKVFLEGKVKSTHSLSDLRHPPVCQIHQSGTG